MLSRGKARRIVLPSIWIFLIAMIVVVLPILLIAICQTIQVPIAMFPTCGALMVSLSVLGAGLHVGESLENIEAAAAWRSRAGSIAHPACTLLWSIVAALCLPSIPLTVVTGVLALVHAWLGWIDIFQRGTFQDVDPGEPKAAT